MNRIPMKGGDEFDALADPRIRRLYRWGKGAIRKIKRKHNKRFRKMGKSLAFKEGYRD